MENKTENRADRKVKYVLILNGLAAPMTEGNYLWTYFKNKRYRVVAPVWLEWEDWWDEAIFVLKVKELLKGVEPAIIFGFSMGGLMVPVLAKEYPRAKLIMVASGARLRIKNRVAKWLLGSWKGRRGKYLYRLWKRWPEKMLLQTYLMINPPPNQGREVVEKYQRYMLQNIRYFRRFENEEVQRIMNLLKEADTRERWKQVKNTTLVLNGKKDPLMPVECGIELKNLMKKCCWVSTEGGHFDTLRPEHLRILDEFC